MTNYETTWTRDELNAYILLFCAHADFVESEDELLFIKDKMKTGDFERIHDEFEADNDFVNTEKIRAAISRLNYTTEDKSALLGDIKELFLTDGEFSILEENLILGLRHILD